MLVEGERIEFNWQGSDNRQDDGMSRTTRSKFEELSSSCRHLQSFSSNYFRYCNSHSSASCDYCNSLLGQQTLLHGSLRVLSNIFVLVEPEPQNLSNCRKVQRSGSKIHSIESGTFKYHLRDVSSIEILLANNFLILDMDGGQVLHSLSVWHKLRIFLDNIN